MRLLKRAFALLILGVFLVNCLPEKGHAQVGVSAESAILMEQASKRVLYGKNIHKKMRIASITKIMTAILAIESGKMNKKVTVSSNAEGVEGSSLYLKAGEKLELKHLVYGLMLRSGNDAATAIAENVGGSKEGFVFLMNQKAEEIGMTNTVFANPHGLDDHENHYSTAYDMSILTQYAMQNEEFREIFGTKKHRAPDPNANWDRVWTNKNKLLTKLYEYCTGGKTGFTKRAKRTLVTTASKNGLDLISVTLNAPDDWNDHISMFEYGFNNYELKRIVDGGPIKEIDYKIYNNHVYINRDVVYPLTKKEEKDISIKMNVIKPKKEWDEKNPPPKTIGKMMIQIGDTKIDELPIYYDKDRKNAWFRDVKDVFLQVIGVNRHG